MAINKKYDDIVNAARKQFFRYGLKRVTIEDVCREANVSKMTFYKHFHNKTGLAKTVLDIVFSESANEFKELMRSEAPFYDKMHGMVKWKIDRDKAISAEFVREIYSLPGVDSEVTSYLKKIIRKGLKGVVDEFATAQKRGLVRQDIKPALLLAMLDKAVEITTDEKVLQAYDNMHDLIEDITKFFIYGIINEK